MNESRPLPATAEPDRSAIPAAATLHWVEPLDRHSDTEQDALGRRRVRTLVQLESPLPLPPDRREGVRSITTRAIDPDRDLPGVVEVNNAAFSWHPEQGGWDEERLRHELAADWVDPAGFLVHEDTDGEIDGFCWTRHWPREGEIYVIGAAPRTHGTGLGTALVVAGLEHLTARGFDRAVLWTEDDNAAALRMYGRLGFVVRRRRGGYS